MIRQCPQRARLRSDQGAEVQIAGVMASEYGNLDHGPGLGRASLASFVQLIDRNTNFLEKVCKVLDQLIQLIKVDVLIPLNWLDYAAPDWLRAFLFSRLNPYAHDKCMAGLFSRFHSDPRCCSFLTPLWQGIGEKIPPQHKVLLFPSTVQYCCHILITPLSQKNLFFCGHLELLTTTLRQGKGSPCLLT